MAGTSQSGVQVGCRRPVIRGRPAREIQSGSAGAGYGRQEPNLRLCHCRHSSSKLFERQFFKIGAGSIRPISDTGCLEPAAPEPPAEVRARQMAAGRSRCGRLRPRPEARTETTRFASNQLASDERQVQRRVDAQGSAGLHQSIQLGSGQDGGQGAPYLLAQLLLDAFPQ